MMPHERRLSVRKAPEHFAYLSLPSNNGGVVLDVSEGGLCFQSIAPVKADGPIHFRFAIDSATRIKAVGELAWIDKTGKTGGLRFTQLPDEVREQIRIWSGQVNAGANARTKTSANARVLDVPVTGPAIEAIIAPSRKAGSATHPLLYNLRPPVYSAPFYKLSMFPLEPAAKAGELALATPRSVPLPDAMLELMRVWPIHTKALAKTRVKASVHDVSVAESAIGVDDAPDSKVDWTPVVSTGHPLLYNLKPPVYSAPSYELSMFPLNLDSEVAATSAVATPVAVPPPFAIRHPIAAVGLTIALAFAVSIGIFAYASTSRAGQSLFNRGEKIWGGFSSQPVSGDPAPPVSSAPGSSTLYHP